MTVSERQRGERIFKGLGVSPGIAIGTAHLRETGVAHVPEYRIPASRVPAEEARFAEAIEQTREQLAALRRRATAMPGAAAEELGYLLDAYVQMLRDSRLVRGVERRIKESRLNAEAAVQAEIAEIGRGFAAVDDAYIASRMDDIRGVANRILRNLGQAPERPLSTLPRGSVVVAEEMTPADTALLDPQSVSGFAAVIGGAEGHTAIMARALGLPAVLGVPGLLAGVATGDAIIVDGENGQVVVNPTPATVALYERRREAYLREQRALARLKRKPAVTRDGAQVVLRANVELPMEIAQVNQMGAAGIGLLRTEFLFMNRADLPGEDEQYAVYRGLAEAVQGHVVTVRTLDIGGEKVTSALVDDFGPSVNSALGLRGIRLSLNRTDLLEVQMRAILRAGAHGPVRVLLPMVSTVAEIRRAREVMEGQARRLRRRGVAVADPLPPLGVMIEVPGAALAADALAQASDFFAIGSNDLTMYTLAIDRSDEQVAPLFDPLHPAVLRLIQFSTEAALRARIPVSICGEVAGDPRYTALLLGLGMRELSMSAAAIPRVKQRILGLDLSAAQRRARVIMDQVDPGRIAALLDDFNALS